MLDHDDMLDGQRRPMSRISVEIDNRVAHILLNNPPRNVLTLQMLQDLTEAVNTVIQEENVCAFVLEAAPECRAFCVGLAPEEQRSDIAYQFLEALHGFARTLEFHSKPVVAIVAEAALGVGCELVACADIVIASEKARFGLPQIKVGVFPSLGAVYLPRVVGMRRAMEMILSGRLLTSQDAQAYGLATFVVPEDQLQSKAGDVIAGLRRLSSPVLEAARRAIAEASGLTIEDGLARVEDIYLNQLMTLEDPGEGMVAVLEKRAPHWRHK
jgi:enoyl-CoA hydratase/carnithine racemase